MKLLGWLFGLFFAVWFVAFVSIKVYDLECVSDPSICLFETGVWFRKLVLLGWVSNWQTLISGFCAVAAGGFVLIAANNQIQYNRNILQDERRSQIQADIFNAFQAVVKLGPIWNNPFDEKTIYVEQAIETVRNLNNCCAELALDITHCLFQLRLSNENYNDLNKTYILCYTYILGNLTDIVESQKGLPRRLLPSELKVNYRNLSEDVQGFGFSIEKLSKIKKYCEPVA